MSLNYFRLWIADYLKDTSSLSVGEHGAYLLLLLEYYGSGPLPDDVSALNRICRAMTTEEQQAVANVAARFFPVNGDGRRHNKRADEELAIALKAIQEMSEAGKEGADKRWGKDRAPHKVPNGEPHRVGDGVSGASSYPLNHLASQPLNPQPLTTHPKAKKRSAARSASAPKKKGNGKEADTAPTWRAFTAEYRRRYQTDPTRNAPENTAMAVFVTLVPLEEAPEIAAFYVRHNKPWYVTHQHSVKYLRQDATGLRTQWLNGRNVTDTEARQADRTQATANVFAPLIEEADRQEEQRRLEHESGK